MGPTVTIAVARRIVFAGTDITPAGSPACPTFCAAEILFTMRTIMYCNVYSFSLSMYSELAIHSFQNPKAVNKPIVAIAGKDNGSTILNAIMPSLAPSIFADSISEAGISLKKLRNRNMFHTLKQAGMMYTQMLLSKCR